MGFSLKKLVEGAVAQVNPFDNGKTFATVQRNQPAPPAQIPQQGMSPQAQAQIQNARYGVLANNPKRQRAFIGSVSQPQLKAFNPILEAPKVIAKEAVPTVGAGIGRSIVGAAEGISGAADLLTPGTGTNRVTKALVNQGRNIDQYIERNNFDKTGYKIAQGTTDIASFLAPGAIAKGASLAAKTGGVTGKVGKALSSTAPLIDKPVLKYATSPANILNTGVGTARSQGYIASREQDVNPGTVATGLGANLLLGTGANVVGSKVVEPLVNSNIGKNIKDGFNVAVSKPQATEELLNKQSKLLTARAAMEVKNKPTGSIDAQISNVDQQIRQATTRPILRPFTNEGGYIQFPGSDKLDDVALRTEIKNRLQKEADYFKANEKQIKDANVVNGVQYRQPGRGKVIAENRRMFREFEKNPDKFIDKYNLLPPQTKQVAPKANEIGAVGKNVNGRDEGKVFYHGTNNKDIKSLADLQAGRGVGKSSRNNVYITENPEIAKNFGSTVVSQKLYGKHLNAKDIGVETTPGWAQDRKVAPEFADYKTTKLLTDREKRVFENSFVKGIPNNTIIEDTPGIHKYLSSKGYTTITVPRVHSDVNGARTETIIIDKKAFQPQAVGKNVNGGGTLRPDKTPNPDMNPSIQGRLTPERAKRIQANVDEMKAFLESGKSRYATDTQPTKKKQATKAMSRQDFNYEAMRIRDNLKAGETGYIKDGGKTYEITRDSTRAKLVAPKEAFHSTASLEIEGGKLRASKDGAMGEGVYLHSNEGTAKTHAAYQGDGNVADQTAYKVKINTDKIHKLSSNNYPTPSEVAAIKASGSEGIMLKDGEMVIFDPNKVELSQPPKSTVKIGTSSNWRESVDTKKFGDDPDTNANLLKDKQDTLRAITQVSKSDSELADVLLRAEQLHKDGYLGDNANLAWDIMQNPASSKTTKARATKLYKEITTPAKSQSPLTVEKTPRTQLTGRALDVPSKTGDPIADALGMSPKTLKEAQTVDPLAQVPSKKKDPVSKYDNIEVGDDGVARHKTYDLNKKVSAIDYLRTPENVLKKIGLAEEGRVLVKAQRELKKELPQQIDKISSWYDRVGRKPEASQRIFRWLDGQKGAKLTGEELAVGKEMKSYFKDWADRLNLPEDRRISNYITHIFDDSLLMKEFDPDLEKLIADQVPGSVYDPYTLQRLGKQGYIEDAFLAAEAYAKRATRKAHMDPALEQLKAASQDLDQSGLNFVKQLGDRVNMRPTQLDNLIDNAIKQGPVGYRFGQRPVAALSRNIRQMTYRATLGLNVGSAVRNLTQGVNTFAELGTEYTTKGYIKALKSLADGNDELQKVGVLDNSFIEDRTLSAMKKGLQRVDKGLWAFFSGAEKINRGAAYFGAKQKALAEGKPLDEAIDIALDTARKTQFTFGAVDTPVALQSDIVKLATQFQSFNVKQTEFIAGMVKNGEWEKVARFVGATGFMMLVMGQLLNYKPQDFIPFANELGKGNAPIAKTPVWQMTGALLKGDLDKAAQSAGATFVPAFVQGKKTVQGIKAVQSGEVKSGNKKYPVEQSPRNMVKGAVFGPYALKPADGKTITDLKKEGMAVNGETDKKTIVNASFNSPEAKKFFELSEDEQKKQAANNPELYALMKQKDAMQKALGTPTLNPGLSEQDKKVLTKAARLTQKAEDEVSYREKDYDYKKLLANYNKNKLEGNITEEEDIKQQKALKKAEVGAQFDKGIRKLYELSKTDLQAKLKDQPNAKDIIAQLEAYDKALVDSKYHAYLKFKNGVMAVSGSGGRRRSGGRRGRSGGSSKLSTQLYAFNSSPVGTNRTLRQLVANAKVKGAKSKKIKTKIA